MKTVSLATVQEHPEVLSFIQESDKALEVLGYTDHGLRHVNIVADRARSVAHALGLPGRTAELAAIAGFCHDMGNFMGRTQHHYWGALLFHQVFHASMLPEEVTAVVQAIANHDKEEMKFTNPIAALLVLADKSDVHRSRVRAQSIEDTLKDEHDRVNYGATAADLSVKPDEKRIDLTLSIDTQFVPVLEYFEIFSERMSYCRRAAEYLGCRFGLVINDFRLL